MTTWQPPMYPAYDPTPEQIAADDAAWDAYVASGEADEDQAALSAAEMANERAIENANHWASLA